eukprot:NODE_1489_length_1127_cov_465.610075.p1 GENE.NODE_1489_length_1127_cov_465.610075~~NODE_1489_length_1127_cov_465.610075.p1  ORF type:complete len:319 (+),score=78.10 NODE_1489_length_1127_cov_465.610075:113-958(+)
MFETWDGALTCVQVVRVPIVPGLSVASMQEILAQTILVKVVKSQQWLSATHAAPNDFVVFCWLPFPVPDAVVEHAEELLQRLRALDPRFSLRLRVPAEPGSLFPALFATKESEYRRTLAECDVSTYTGEEDSDDDSPCDWDITWAWDEDWGVEEDADEVEGSGAGNVAEGAREAVGEVARGGGKAGGERAELVGEGEQDEADVEWEWDIAWVVDHDDVLVGSGGDGLDVGCGGEGEQALGLAPIGIAATQHGLGVRGELGEAGIEEASSAGTCRLVWDDGG